MSKFQVSDDFTKFEVQAGSALQEAREAEKNARGCDLPPNTTGALTITGASTIKLKSKYKNADGTAKPDYPAITMQFSILSPESFKGRAQSRVFGMEDHEKMSAAAKYQQWLDFCEDAGLPREIRKMSTAEIFNWFAAEPRMSSYIVEESNGYKNIKTTSGNSAGVIPQATATQTAIEAALAANAGLNTQPPGQFTTTEQITAGFTPEQLGQPAGAPTTPATPPVVQSNPTGSPTIALIPGQAYSCFQKPFVFVRMDEKDPNMVWMKSNSTGKELQVPIAQVMEL